MQGEREKMIEALQDSDIDARLIFDAFKWLACPEAGCRGEIEMEVARTAVHVRRAMNSPCKTILQILEGTTEYLARRRIETPRLNAEHLVAHVLGKRRLDLYLEFDRPLGEEELGPIREMLKKRGQGVPLQHLLGTVEFLGRTFKIDRRALIPRPETEQLVQLTLAAAPPSADRFLDVGTGSGVIALTLADEKPAATILAVDASPDALALARTNAADLGLEERVAFLQSDLLSQVEGTFDVIVANLPYIPTDDIPQLAREVQHDPATALDGGKEGLDFIDRLIETASPRLVSGGLIALEIGHDQAERVLGKLEQAGYRNCSAKADFQRINRFAFATNR